MLLQQLKMPEKQPPVTQNPHVKLNGTTMLKAFKENSRERDDGDEGGEGAELSETRGQPSVLKNIHAQMRAGISSLSSWFLLSRASTLLFLLWRQERTPDASTAYMLTADAHANLHRPFML